MLYYKILGKLTNAIRELYRRLLLLLVTLLRTLTRVLSLDSTGSATSVWRLWSEVNVLLGVQSHHERWDVDNLLTNSNVSLGNQDSSVVDRSGQTQLENLSLQSSLQEILDSQSQDVIQLHLVLTQDTNSHQSSDQSVTFEQSLLVLVISGKQVTSSSSDLRQLKTNSVDLSLVLQTVLTGQLQFSVQTSRLIWLLWHGVSLRVSSWGTWFVSMDGHLWSGLGLQNIQLQSPHGVVHKGIIPLLMNTPCK